MHYKQTPLEQMTQNASELRFLARSKLELNQSHQPSLDGTTWRDATVPLGGSPAIRGPCIVKIVP